MKRTIVRLELNSSLVYARLPSWMRESSINYVHPTGWHILILTLIPQVTGLYSALNQLGEAVAGGLTVLLPEKASATVILAKLLKNLLCHSAICHSLCASTTLLYEELCPSLHALHISPTLVLIYVDEFFSFFLTTDYFCSLFSFSFQFWFSYFERISILCLIYNFSLRSVSPSLVWWICRNNEAEYPKHNSRSTLKKIILSKKQMLMRSCGRTKKLLKGDT